MAYHEVQRRRRLRPWTDVQRHTDVNEEWMLLDVGMILLNGVKTQIITRES